MIDSPRELRPLWNGDNNERRGAGSSSAPDGDAHAAHDRILWVADFVLLGLYAIDNAECIENGLERHGRVEHIGEDEHLDEVHGSTKPFRPFAATPVKSS